MNVIPPNFDQLNNKKRWYFFKIPPKIFIPVKVLSTELEELMSNDVTIELNLLEPYLKIFNDLKKENPKYFFKALLLLEKGIKLSNIQSVQIDALEHCWNVYESCKPRDKKLLNSKILDEFNDIETNGLNILDNDNAEFIA